MKSYTIEFPEPLSQQIKASGLSRQQLGKVMTYLLEMYLKANQNKEFIQIATADETEQSLSHVESFQHNGTSIPSLGLEPRKLGAGKWKGNTSSKSWSMK